MHSISNISAYDCFCLLPGDEMCHIYAYENGSGFLPRQKLLHFLQVWWGIGSSRVFLYK